MEKEITQILNAMDVKQNREDAESKAISIYKLGPEALDTLLEIGLATEKKPIDTPTKRKCLRAVILAISIFFTKNKYSPKTECHARVMDFLMDLSMKNFQSAKTLLGTMGYSESDVIQKKLLSLPVAEKHLHDKIISVNEALEEIRLGKFLSGGRGFKQDHYVLGKDKKKAYALYRVDKKKFALRGHTTL
ncbi:MAG: hypothetical protein HUN04_10715 [Desulfobacter sp.]|nr:MAG: hypothetical protein HUN04_10715 [Desulfobacter sp.]